MPPWDFRFFVISSYLTTTNTREVGLNLTVLNHFHLFLSDPLGQSAEGGRRGTYFVGQSKRDWPIWPTWFLAGQRSGVGACFHESSLPLTARHHYTGCSSPAPRPLVPAGNWLRFPCSIPPWFVLSCNMLIINIKKQIGFVLALIYLLVLPRFAFTGH